MRNTAYLNELQQFIDEGDLVMHPEVGIIEVRKQLDIFTPYMDKSKNGVWKEGIGRAVYKPGQVLYSRWRPVREGELLQWSQSNISLDELGVFIDGNSMSIVVVERVGDLPGIIRQRARHIPGSKFGRYNAQFQIQGTAGKLLEYGKNLMEITQRLLTPTAADDLDSISREIAQSANMLVGSKAELVESALEEVVLALQGPRYERPPHVSQAVTYLMQERARDIRIVLQVLEFAERLLHFAVAMSRCFRQSYVKFGYLAGEIQRLDCSKSQNIQRLHNIAQEGYDEYVHLLACVPNFNPYYIRLQAPIFQSSRLGTIVEDAHAGKYKTVFNKLNSAVQSLEALAIRDRPSQGEIDRLRSSFI